jgi:DNA-binding Xre family transcriptional regulator
MAVVRWKLPEILRDRGLTAYRLAAMLQEAGYQLTVRGAYRLADPDHELRRLDLDTLNAVCNVLGLKTGDVLEIVPDKPKRKRG